jgi:hypothetical protein
MANASPVVTIDLGDYRGSKENRVLSGRGLGAEARRGFELDRLDESPTTVNVLVPEDLFSVTSSWFLATFGDSIRRLGADKFRSHYRFLGKSMSSVVDDAIQAVALIDPLG